MKTVGSSRLHSVCIYIDYFESGEWNANLVCVGEALDDTGEITAGSSQIEFDQGDLPAQVDAKLRDFLKHMSREFNKEIADEDSETLE